MAYRVAAYQGAQQVCVSRRWLAKVAVAAAVYGFAGGAWFAHYLGWF